MGEDEQQQEALKDWIRAAEALRDFAAQPESGDPTEGQQARQLIKEVLRAENRIRAIHGFLPRMFNSPDNA